jgi:hypothetical protein
MKTTKKEIDKMPDDEFFKILDKRASQIIIRPLNNFHKKLYASTANLLNKKNKHHEQGIK